MDLDALGGVAHRARADPAASARRTIPAAGSGAGPSSAPSPTSAPPHDLLLISDEIHHDLVLPGHRHVPMPLAAPNVLDRLVMLTATTKTFNIAGALTGNVIIPDEALRQRFAAAHLAAGPSPNRFGVLMATAAYAGGDAWVDALRAYLAGNARRLRRRRQRDPRRALDAARGARISPGSTSPAPAWRPGEFTARVERDARIAPSHGPAFGKGGESFLRFNLATPRARVEEAVRRLQAAFADLQ